MTARLPIELWKGMGELKRYRPFTSGFIVLYALTLLCAGDAIFTLYGQATGTLNEYMQSFSFFSYLILAMALGYVWMYVRAQVAIGEKTVRFAFPTYVRPKQGESRAMILYRQGDTDLKFVDKTFELGKIVRWGYVEDLGYERIDKSGATEKSPLFPVHEVAFITSDNKRYHWNCLHYGKKPRREILSTIAERCGVKPEGKLAEELQ